MVNNSKKVISFLFSVIMCLGIFMCAFEGTLPMNVMTSEAAGMTVEQLKAKFPHGKYWNHSGSNNADGYTSSPCTHHGNCSKGGTDYSGWCGCNSFYGIQCAGFAYKLGYDAFGSVPTSWTQLSNMNSLKAGDIIRYKNNHHSIFVTGVNGNTITYADCNSDGHCKIMWDKTISKSDIWGFNYVKSAPSALQGGSSVSSFPGEEDNSYSVPISVTASKRINTYDGNGNQESNRYIDAGDACTIDKVYKNGFVHIGYPTSSGTRWAYAKKDDFDLKPAPSSQSPNGVVDSVSGGAGTVSVAGWGFDPDNTSVAIDAHVYLRDSSGNMLGVGVIKADKQRDDVNNVHGCGSYHGYSETLSTDYVGNYHVMVALIDSGSDGATWCDGGDITITSADKTNPVISNVTFSKITPTGFTVKCNATDDRKIKDVKVAIWINDVTEPIWHDCISTGNDTYSFDFDISSYNNQKGPYNCHIYAWDENDNHGFGATEPITINCNIGDNFDAIIKTPSADEYVTVSAVDDNVILYDASAYTSKRVWNFARQADDSYTITSYFNGMCLEVNKAIDETGRNICTFTPNGGVHQRWFIVQHGGSYRLMPACSNTRSLDIEGAEAKSKANIQLWENNDSIAQKFNIDKVSDTTAPQIKDVKISDVTKDGYKVIITVSDNVGIKKVAVPTWTQSGGQNDLFPEWNNTALATQTDKNTWTYNVKVSEHNNECGVYYTDVYAWDFNDNMDSWHGENGKRTTIEVGMFELTVNPNGGTVKDENGKDTTKSYKTAKHKLIYKQMNFNSMSWTKPSRIGYTFTGWYTEAKGGTKVHGTDGKCINEGAYFKNDVYQKASDLTLYAQWKANSYTVTLNTDGGNCDKKNISVTYDSEYGTLPSPMKKGYTFTGWYTAETGGTKITADSKVSITANQTLYAQYKAEDVKGDVNNDGEFSVADVVLLQKWLLGVPDIKLDNWKSADLCEDSRLDVFDLCLMKKMLINF